MADVLFAVALVGATYYFVTRIQLRFRATGIRESNIEGAGGLGHFTIRSCVSQLDTDESESHSSLPDDEALDVGEERLPGRKMRGTLIPSSDVEDSEGVEDEEETAGVGRQHDEEEEEELIVELEESQSA